VGQWAATAMYNWRFRFQELSGHQEQKEGIRVTGGCRDISSFLTENVGKSPSVYARLRGRPPVLAVSDTLVPQGIIKTVAVPANAGKNNGFKRAKRLKTGHVYATKTDREGIYVKSW